MTPILAPYRVPAFRALADTPGWDVRIFVNAESEFDRSWQVDAGGLDVESIATWSIPRSDRTLHLTAPWSLWRALGRFQPDVVVSAEFGSRSLAAWCYCKRHQIPLVLWALPTEAHIAECDPLRRALGPFLLKRAASVAVPGNEAALLHARGLFFRWRRCLPLFLARWDAPRPPGRAGAAHGGPP